jgi:hemolysin activation/secretion protein
LLGQIVSGTDIPVHALATMGGTRTLRGYPQDRFLDETAAVLNAEIRFPIYWRFGGVVGMDAGRVFRSPSALTLGRWAVNSVVGLRLYMDTFVVRADLGFGKETTGFYLNFGHLF